MGFVAVAPAAVVVVRFVCDCCCCCVLVVFAVAVALAVAFSSRVSIIVNCTAGSFWSSAFTEAFRPRFQSAPRMMPHASEVYTRARSISVTASISALSAPMREVHLKLKSCST